MSKTKQTLEIEQALIKRTNSVLGCYGAKGSQNQLAGMQLSFI